MISQLHVEQYCALVSALFAGALSSYPARARRNGWVLPRIFDTKNLLPSAVFLATMGLLSGISIGWTLAHTVSWLFPLSLAVAVFFGGLLLAIVFRTRTGAVALVVAPAFALAASVIGI